MTRTGFHGITIKDHVPRGYRSLDSYMVHQTPKALLCAFDGITAWLPRKAVIEVNGRYWGAEWAIKSAHEYHGNQLVKAKMNGT